MNRFEKWIYWHLVPRRTRERTEAQIKSVCEAVGVSYDENRHRRS
jgi:ribosomal protein L12E/L44/L45/RPP1/RPP2